MSMPFNLSHVKALIQTLETDLQLLKDAVKEFEQSQQQDKNHKANAPHNHNHKPLPSQSYLSTLQWYKENVESKC
jgi:hypothetical protein